MSEAARVLVVANKTAATPALHRGGARARGPRAGDASRCWCRTPRTACTSSSIPRTRRSTEAEATLELALPLLEAAAGAPVEGMIGVPEPLAAIQDAINIHGFDELIISTLPQRVSKWLKLDLPSKAAGLGLPVTTVIASEPRGARDGLA